MTAARLALFYAVYFGTIGILLPFWPTWLEAQGVGAAEIGTILAAGAIAKIFASPAIAHVADRRGGRKGVMVAVAAIAAGAFALHGAAAGFLVLLALWALFSAVWNPLLSLGESLTIITARTRKLEYGPVRLWGSLAFIVASVGGGWLLEGRDAGLIFYLVLGGTAAMVAACLALPDTRVEASETKRLPLGAVLADRRYIAAMAAGALIQSSHAVYYAFGTIHWRAAGHSEAVIGWLWAEGVIAETLLFLWGGAVRRRLGPGALFALAGAAALVRWTALAATTDLTVLLVVQVLHGLTFGAAHLGIINFVGQHMPPALSATAMSLYSAVVMGIASGGTMAAAGWLYAGFGGGAYYAMAAMGAAGGLAGLLIARSMRDRAGTAA